LGRPPLDFETDREAAIMSEILQLTSDKAIAQKYSMSLSAVKFRRLRAGIRLTQGQKPGNNGKRGYIRAQDDVPYEPQVPPEEREALAIKRKAKGMGMSLKRFMTEWLPGKTWTPDMGFR
jgi:hypothetical protein